MSRTAAQVPPPLPGGLMVAGSLVVSIHLLIIVIHTLAAPSGPWPTPFGPSTAEPPFFVKGLESIISQHYLRHLRMTHNYHFQANNVEVVGTYFEVKLLDQDKKEIKTLKFPDPEANAWVRHRQGLLAQFLAEDTVVQPPGADVVFPPDKPIPKVTIWKEAKPGDFKTFKLDSIPQSHIPRDRMVERPSPYSQVLAQSYIRYMTRLHGASRAEVHRHTRGSIGPHWALAPEIPQEVFGERVSIFAE